MDTKLTLKLNQSVIEKAKFYAKSKKTSVSKLIENYLQSITENSSNNKQDITPVVKSLSGIIKLPKNYDSKKEYADFLTKKYK
jgi:ribosomal protein S17E